MQERFDTVRGRSGTVRERLGTVRKRFGTVWERFGTVRERSGTVRERFGKTHASVLATSQVCTLLKKRGRTTSDGVDNHLAAAGIHCGNGLARQGRGESSEVLALTPRERRWYAWERWGVTEGRGGYT